MRYFLPAIFVLILAGCGTFVGAAKETPQNANDLQIVTEYSYQEVEKNISDLIASGVIDTEEEINKVEELRTDARLALEDFRAAADAGGNITDARTALLATNAALIRYLARVKEANQ